MLHFHGGTQSLNRHLRNKLLRPVTYFYQSTGISEQRRGKLIIPTPALVILICLPRLESYPKFSVALGKRESPLFDFHVGFQAKSQI